MKSKKIVFAILVFVVLGVSTWIYLDLRPHGTAVAQVLVVQVGQNRNPWALDYMSTQRVLIRSMLLAEKVANSEPIQSRLSGTGFRSFPEVKNTTDLIPHILQNLSLVPDKEPENNIMNLSYQADDPQEANLILESLVRCYQDFLDETYMRIPADKLLKEISELELKIKQNRENPDREAEMKFNQERLDKINNFMKWQDAQNAPGLQVKVISPPWIRK